MSSKTVNRLSGFALLFGSLLVVVITILLIVLQSHQGNSNLYASPLWQPMLMIMMLGLLLIVAGLAGMYNFQARRSGWRGLIGFILTGLAMLFFAAFIVVYAFVIPSLDTHSQLLLTGYNDMNLNNDRIPPLVALFQVAALLLSIGAFLLGRATMRAGVLPRSAGIAFLYAVPAGFLICLFPLASLSQPLVWSGFGEFLWFISVLAIPIGILAFFIGLAISGYALLSPQKAESTLSQSIITKA